MNEDDATLDSAGLSALWDFTDPKTSAERFEQFAARAHQKGLSDLAAMAHTQHARALGLQRRFEDGFALIARVEEEHPDACEELVARIAIERGRLMNSSGDPGGSVRWFTNAFEITCAAGLDGLAVDAAHMLGIVVSGDAGMDWNRRAMDLALASDQSDARRWRGSLLNNMGWSMHSAGAYADALSLFQDALRVREEEGKPREIRIARWCIGRCLRSLSRLDEALAVQRELEKDPDADGYIFEEIGECLHAMGRTDEARPMFRRAHAVLVQDPWLVANESDRLSRLERLGSG